MRTAPHSSTVAAVAVLALACAEATPTTAPAGTDAPRAALAEAGAQSVTWASYEITCPDGVKRPQLQSVYPLDDANDIVLIGRSPCLGSEDFQVVDLSSGVPVMLDAFDAGEAGFNLGVHSPAGSLMGFGVEGTSLVTFVPHLGFSKVPILCAGACLAFGVWANTPNDVWVAGDGQIARYHNGVWTIEYRGFLVRDIWGFAGNPPVIYGAGSGIVQRLPNGTWREVLSPAALPATCPGGFWSLHGSGPTDLWAASSPGCVFHGTGLHWFQTPGPANAFQGAIAAAWALDPQHVLLASQGGVDLTLGNIALWATADGGASWMQVSDPLFTTLPTTTDASFFNLAVSLDGSRIYAPSIAGTLLVGTIDWSAIASRAVALGTAPPAGAAVSPEY